MAESKVQTPGNQASGKIRLLYGKNPAKFYNPLTASCGLSSSQMWHCLFLVGFLHCWIQCQLSLAMLADSRLAGEEVPAAHAPALQLGLLTCYFYSVCWCSVLDVFLCVNVLTVLKVSPLSLQSDYCIWFCVEGFKLFRVIGIDIFAFFCILRSSQTLRIIINRTP